MRPSPVRAESIPTVSSDDADEPEDDEARHGPVRDLRGEQHPDDEDRDREEVEQAVGEDGAEQRRARPAAVRQVAAEDGDAGELSRARRQDGVPEQPDPEGGEDLAEARMRLRQRLVDRQPPRERARERGEQVEQRRRRSPSARRPRRTRRTTAPHSGPRHQIARIAAASSGEHEDARAPRGCARCRRATAHAARLPSAATARS